MPTGDPDRISVQPSPATAGQSITITFEDLQLAPGTSVTITLDNGHGIETTVQLTMGPDGIGTTTWMVPQANWTMIKLNEPSSAEHVVAVQQP